MKALGLVVSEKMCLCFFHDAPGEGPVWTPGAQLAGIIKRTFIHSYTQNRKALGLLVLEKIFFMFFHCKSMGANDPRGGAIFDASGMVCRIYKEDYYTIQNMIALGLVVSEKKIFSVFPITAGPV